MTANATERAEQVSHYTDVLGSTQFCEAFFFAPIVGTIIDANQKLLRKWQPHLDESIVKLKTSVFPLACVAFFGFMTWVSKNERLEAHWPKN